MYDRVGQVQNAVSAKWLILLSQSADASSYPSGMIDTGDRRDRRRMDNTAAAQHGGGYPMDVFAHGMGPKIDQTKA